MSSLTEDRPAVQPDDTIFLDDRDLFDLPTEADEQWNAETSPLNRDLYFVEGDDRTAIELWTTSEAEYREPTDQDWNGYAADLDRIDAMISESQTRPLYP